MNDIQSLSNSKWRCHYHIVFAPVYLLRVLKFADKNSLFTKKVINKFDVYSQMQNGKQAVVQKRDNSTT